jgi:hypothetical protein
MKTRLLIGLLLCGAAFAADPVAGQTPGPAPKTVSNFRLMPVIGAAKEQLFRSLSENKRGVRTLTPARPQECVNGASTVDTIACGGSGSGQLSSTDCVLSDGSYWDAFTFSGTAGQQVTITMNSSAFDTYLVLLDPTKMKAAEDDNGAGGTDSRIVFTLSSSGDWYIIANSRTAAQFGPYTLVLQCSAAPPPGACTANATTLCLNNGRFRVQATYTTATGQSGPGMAVPQTSDTGLFWFFSANNIEVIIKVLNACTFAAGPRYWVFAGGLTNVQVVLTVTDASNGTTRIYTNPQNTAFAPVQDTDAFATCP